MGDQWQSEQRPWFCVSICLDIDSKKSILLAESRVPTMETVPTVLIAKLNAGCAESVL